ncbi:hypothetical protein LCGC14_1603840 [marine sediment metagenome]|uniref:Uncharacterized protein n=1 Tax=marine sediment metagenome TaxID=412755 RepID=A0A0F9IAE9_9ZZZZ
MRNLTTTLTIVCDATDAAFADDCTARTYAELGMQCQGDKEAFSEKCVLCLWFIDLHWGDFKETTQCSD